jgi:hypothetical protein
MTLQLETNISKYLHISVYDSGNHINANKHAFCRRMRHENKMLFFIFRENEKNPDIKTYLHNTFCCRKDDFRLCIGLLPAYVEKIEELALSEQNTPGQVHAFLSFFPSFAPFKRLRKLNFHFNAEAVSVRETEETLRSLLETNIETLSIKVVNAARMSSLEGAMGAIFQLKTLKKLSLISDNGSTDRFFLNDVSSNVEYLTISGIHCDFENLGSIFRCASDLKYFNIQVTPSRRPRARKNLTKNIILMPKLRSVVFNFGNDAPEFDLLSQYLKGMPALRRLEIKAHHTLFDADAWETLVKTSMPSLIYLHLETNRAGLELGDIQELLDSYQTPFWLERKNFKILIIECAHLDSDRFAIDKMQRLGSNGFYEPVAQWWTGPLRGPNDNVSSMNKIFNLGLSVASNSLSQYRYLDNVDQLILYDLDDELLKLMKKYMDCSRVKHLDISQLVEKSYTAASVLSCTKNIKSLQATVTQLLIYQHVYLRTENCIKYLDVSLTQSDFDETEILTIAKLFPKIEHLAINTENLGNVPKLKIYLPHLRSLAFKITDSEFLYIDSAYEKQMWEQNLRQKTNFLFQREEDWITVWIDQDVFEERYWKTFGTDSSQWMDE